MPFKSIADIATAADYQKNLKKALAESARKPAVLQVFSDYTLDKKKGFLVLVGPVDGKLLETIVKSGAKREGVKGSVTETQDLIRYKASGLKPDVLTKALKEAKIQKMVSIADFIADAAEGEESGSDASPETPAKSGTPTPQALTLAAAEKLKGFAADYTRMAAHSADNVAGRLKALKQEADDQIKAASGKEALKAVEALDKLVDVALGLYAQNLKQKVGLLDRVGELGPRLDGYKPPLHVKPKSEMKLLLGKVGAGAKAEAYCSDVDKFNKICDEVGKTLDDYDSLSEDYAEKAPDYSRLKLDVDRLVKLATPAKIKLMLPDDKKALTEHVKAISKVKPPATLYDKDPYTELMVVLERARDWLQDHVEDKTGAVSTDPVAQRKAVFKHDKPSTWDLTAVSYLNGTSASDIGSKAGDLANASLSSRTTAKGSVLKVDFEGHEHLDGGSGGMAFVYKLNADYTVTPTVVDLSSKRGGKNGNQYEWNSGGGWSYFPPNASY